MFEKTWEQPVYKKLKNQLADSLSHFLSSNKWFISQGVQSVNPEGGISPGGSSNNSLKYNIQHIVIVITKPNSGRGRLLTLPVDVHLSPNASDIQILRQTQADSSKDNCNYTILAKEALVSIFPTVEHWVTTASASNARSALPRPVLPSSTKRLQLMA